MNRRTALALSLMTGGLLPLGSRALAQDLDDPRDPPASSTRKKKAAPKAARPADDEPPAEEADDRAKRDEDDNGQPGDAVPSAGLSLRTWDISKYTTLAYTSENSTPEARIVDWIFRRTGSADWHGPKPTVLSASRTQIRAYHDKKMLDKVNEVVRRFTKSYFNYLEFRVRFIRAADTRWRYLVHSRMTSLAHGPQGQQVWSISPTDAAGVVAQMHQYRGFEVLLNKSLKVVNGQTLVVEKYEPVDFTAGVQRDGAAGFGFQPAPQQLREQVVLRMSPLLSYEGDSLELALDLQTNIVRRFVKTSILTRREVGPNDIQIDVPEVTETRINLPIANWPIGQSLLISAGITPGIFEPKNGLLGLPGTKPTDRELLVLLDVETTGDAPRSARRSRSE